MPPDPGTQDGEPDVRAPTLRLHRGGDRAEPLARWLPRAVRRHPAGVVTTGEPHPCAERTHSRLADGRLLCWRPSGAAGLFLAIDAELAGQPVPRALARAAATDDPIVFWSLWTRAEVRAKLHRIPIAVWLRRTDWAADADPRASLDVVTVRSEGVVVSYGVRWPSGTVLT